MSATMTGTDSTPDTGTSTDPTATATDTGATQGTSATGTTGAVCEPDQLCGFDCCGAGELCDNGECVPDCGGPPPCGVAKECCAEGDLCYLGECVTPGAACDEQVCATKPDPQQLRRGLPVRPVAQAVPADEGRPRLSVHPAAEPVQAGAAVHVGQAQGDRLRQGPRLSDPRSCAPTRCARRPGSTGSPPATTCRPTTSPRRSRWSSTSTTTACPTSSSTRTPARAPPRTGVIRAIRGDTGEKLWTVTDPAYRTNSTSNPAVGDIDLDGKPEVVSVGDGKHLVAFKSDGTPLWKSDPFTGATGSGSVAIANMDKRGPPGGHPRRRRLRPPRQRRSGRAPPASASTGRAPSPASPTSTPTGDPSSSADAPPTRPPA
jgi:hypothetical protein